MGSPAPLKMRPTISGASARRMGLPVKRLAVPESVMPLVPANTWMTARSPSNAAMRPARAGGGFLLHHFLEADAFYADHRRQAGR